MSWRQGGVAVIAALAVAGIALLAVAWRSEANGHHAANVKLAAARVQVASLTGQLASTRTSLAQVQRIAVQRRAVLLRADSTLRGVDSLLTQVDRLREAAANAQDAERVWGNSVIDAYNYLVNNQYAINWDYANSLIATANSLLNGTTTTDAAYAAAATAFGTKADAFTQSVRALQRQLRLVTPG